MSYKQFLNLILIILVPSVAFSQVNDNEYNVSDKPSGVDHSQSVQFAPIQENSNLEETDTYYDGNEDTTYYNYVNCELKINKLIRHAKMFIGTPYVWAANGPDSFDCSGFVHYLYSYAGIDVKRNSKQLSQGGIYVPLRKVKKGDLVFFVSGTPPERDITHVGIVISDYDKKNNDFRFIHANRGAGCVSIDNYKDSRFKNSYGGVRRYFDCLNYD